MASDYRSDLSGFTLFNFFKRKFLIAALILVCLGFMLGVPRVEYGHLGLHRYIWELLPLVTSFNPILGTSLWLGFIIGDYSTKTIGPATGNLGYEYWSFLYIGMLAYAIIPAVIGRLFSRWMFDKAGSYFNNLSSESSEGTMYDGAIPSVIYGLGYLAAQGVLTGVGSAATTSILLDGVNVGGIRIIPSAISRVWNSVYIGLGSDYSCYARAVSDIGQHTSASIKTSGVGGLLGGTVDPMVIAPKRSEFITDSQRKDRKQPPPMDIPYPQTSDISNDQKVRINERIVDIKGSSSTKSSGDEPGVGSGKKLSSKNTECAEEYPEKEETSKENEDTTELQE